MQKRRIECYDLSRVCHRVALPTMQPRCVKFSLCIWQSDIFKCLASDNSVGNFVDCEPEGMAVNGKIAPSQGI